MPPREAAIRVFSTFPRLDRIDLPADVSHGRLSTGSIPQLARAYFSGGRECRCFLFNGLSRGVWVLTLLKLLFPRRHRKLIVVDMILSVPTRRRDWLMVSLRRKLLAAIDLFVSYARDTTRIREIYRLPASRFVYVPFKVNDWERISNMETPDEGYLVVAGQTRRDFPTFFRAIDGLTIPIRIVAPEQEVLSRHASTLPTDGWPENVVFVRDAVGPEEFLPQLAGARLVVLPILAQNITPSGISVCLAAMALEKCVIVSSGPATRGLVDEGQAIVVPPGDPAALREAIVTAWEDLELRSNTARRGYDYARSLGGESRLYQDLLETVLRCCQA